jgi:hypothetical protein
MRNGQESFMIATSPRTVMYGIYAAQGEEIGSLSMT